MARTSSEGRRLLQEAGAMRRRLMVSLSYQLAALERYTPTLALQQELAGEMQALRAAQKALRDWQDQLDVMEQRRAEREVWR